MTKTHENGFIEHTVHQDCGAVAVALHVDSREAGSPEARVAVEINLERSEGSQRTWIDEMTAGEIDALAESLRLALERARAGGILAPREEST